jgi:hypothetical protein
MRVLTVLCVKATLLCEQRRHSYSNVGALKLLMLFSDERRYCANFSELKIHMFKVSALSRGLLSAHSCSWF